MSGSFLRARLLLLARLTRRPFAKERRIRIASAAALITLIVLLLAACERTASHEADDLRTFPGYDDVEQAGGSTFQRSPDRAYGGSSSAKAHYTSPPSGDPWARGKFNVDVPHDYNGYYGAAFWFPVGTFSGGQSAKLKGRLDIMRWDNQRTVPDAQNPNFGGIRLLPSDKKARLVRWQQGSAATEIGTPFELKEGCWNWVVVRQKLDENTPAATNNEVFVNGTQVVSAAAKNHYANGDNSFRNVDHVRFGIAGVDEAAQSVPLDFYVDESYVSNTEQRAPLANACDSQPKPNVVFIVTDDQRHAETMQVMPKTREWFHTGSSSTNTPGGSAFPEAVATSPVCCPARASILSGRYVHNHEVRTNNDGANFSDDVPTSLPAYLKSAGYQTAIYGKYLNGFNRTEPPPVWDDYALVDNYAQSPGAHPESSGFCPFDSYEKNGGLKRYPALNTPNECQPDRLGRSDAPESPYSVHYVRNRATQFIEQASQGQAPFFLYLAMNAPHHPMAPEAQYASASVPAFTPNASHNESDQSDKPPLPFGDQKLIFDMNTPTGVSPGWRTQQLRSLMSVDDTVDAVMRKLEQTGEHNTLAFFVSDNGFMWREHGLWQHEYWRDDPGPNGEPRDGKVSLHDLQGCWKTWKPAAFPNGMTCGLAGKGKPYTDSIRIPFYVRWPGQVPAGVSDNRMVANIDMAQTAIQAVNNTSDPDIVQALPNDGMSLLGSTQTRPNGILTEMFGGNGWASIRTPTYQYIETYKDDDPATPENESLLIDFREYYNLTSDPHQLANVYGTDGEPTADDPPSSPSAATLSSRLADYRLCAGRAGSPVPGKPACP